MSSSAVEISLFSHRMAAICEEMGAVLKRSAISPNIRDREDYSCALFDASGELVAQAAHIPVHLGSMAYAMKGVVSRISWQPGDVVVFNDPSLGGTHLPDVTLVLPIFRDAELVAFSAVRAHHADIGGRSPGSMGVERRLEDEGLIIAPCYWFRQGVEDHFLTELFHQRVRASEERMGDLSAQRSAAELAIKRLEEFQADELKQKFTELFSVSESYGRKAIASIPDGIYSFKDQLEDDGCGSSSLTIAVQIEVKGDAVRVDFSGTSEQSTGPVNTPLAVTAASVFYVFRCLMPKQTPQTSAIFYPVSLTVPEGSLLNAAQGVPVAAGNVETSQRIVDVLLGALAKAVPERIPAAAQGTMNNVIFGGKLDGKEWVYYETVAGGMGGHSHGDGLSAVQCHMTNTKNSSIEVLEMHYPLRISQYAIRPNSGGEGRYNGGDGVVREWIALDSCHLSLLTERRRSRPYGLAGGEMARCGNNLLCRDGQWHKLEAKGSFELIAGDRIRVETPGGGGYGKARISKEES